MDILDGYLERYGVRDIRGKLDFFYEELIEWNEKFNLTAITEKEEVYEKHFIDSLMAVTQLPRGAKVCDIGSGAGLPVIPLALARPDCTFTSVDSLNKRVGFIDHIIDELEIDNCTAYHVRAEDWAQEHREEYDVCTARAVAPMNVLSEYCMPLVKKGGIMLAYKGADGEKELKAAAKALKLLGAGNVNTLSTTLPCGDRRMLIAVHKIKPTPAAYPRGGNKPRLSPLA
ncbi:MAG: 16S rRNA (guanine(527)-N(7))-methyltransferase RsmG [Clostridia bacterium]|nr:16S rRNA (guanine(527)-N(7))-methyltransferase RsmG [Clostridia bacterium]